MLKKERLPVLHWICPCFKFLLCLCIWFFFFQIKFLTHLSSAFPHHLFSPLLSHTDLRDLCHPGSWPQVWILPPEMTPDSFLFPYIVHFPVSDSLHPWFSPCLGFITGQSDNCREDPIGRYPRVVGVTVTFLSTGWEELESGSPGNRRLLKELGPCSQLQERRHKLRIQMLEVRGFGEKKSSWLFFFKSKKKKNNKKPSDLFSW